MKLQTQEKEHGGVLSVAKMDKPSSFCGCDHLTQKSNEREENLEESFPFPSSQPRRSTADEIHRVGHRRREQSSGLHARREIPTKHLYRPPDREHDEE